MTRFHINSHGIPGACSAQAGNCPFGGQEDHFSTKEEARQSFEKKNAVNEPPKSVSKNQTRMEDIRRDLEEALLKPEADDEFARAENYLAYSIQVRALDLGTPSVREHLLAHDEAVEEFHMLGTYLDRQRADDRRQLKKANQVKILALRKLQEAREAAGYQVPGPATVERELYIKK